MSAMASSGCDRVFFGVESGSNEVLKCIRKGFTPEKAWATVVKTKKRIEDVVASFVWGFPCETDENFLKTLDMAVRFSEYGVTSQLGLLSPSIGTHIFSKYSDELRFDPKIVSSMRIARATPFKNINMATVRVKEPETIEIIKSDRNAFHGFYIFDNGNPQRKLQLARKFFLEKLGTEIVIESTV